MHVGNVPDTDRSTLRAVRITLQLRQFNCTDIRVDSAAFLTKKKTRTLEHVVEVRRRFFAEGMFVSAFVTGRQLLERGAALDR